MILGYVVFATYMSHSYLTTDAGYVKVFDSESEAKSSGKEWGRPCTVLKVGDEKEMWVICSCGAEWWLDYEPPKCECPGDDENSRIELRVRENS